MILILQTRPMVFSRGKIFCGHLRQIIVPANQKFCDHLTIFHSYDLIIRIFFLSDLFTASILFILVRFTKTFFIIIRTEKQARINTKYTITLYFSSTPPLLKLFCIYINSMIPL